MLTRLYRNLTLWLIGVVWALAGISKLIDPLLNSADIQIVTWASSFPNAIIISVAIFECIIAIGIFARFRWVPIILGSFLLTSFMISLWIWPPEYQQPCGCFGIVELFDTIDPVSKIIVFGGLHTLAAALIWVSQPSGVSIKKEHPLVPSK